MTVKELIERLAMFAPDATVVVRDPGWDAFSPTGPPSDLVTPDSVCENNDRDQFVVIERVAP